ncbi:MAG: site-specific integrase, partial [Proteobacteria bacterium]|nr:site-specific integrase [Pseudomonadota bacterium]
MNGSIRRRGKSSWELKYELPRHHVTGLRHTAYRTIKGLRKDAEKELRAILSAQDNGIVIDPSRITLGDFLDDWLKNTAPQSVKPKSLERYSGLVRNQIKPHIGTVQLQKLRPADVSAWLQTLIRDTNLSTRSIRHAHGVLRTALAYAAAIEIIPRNVATIIKPPTLESPEIEILTSDQVADAMAKLADHPSLYPIFCIAIGTGARRGEIAALRWSDIDLDARTMRIERSFEQTAGGIRVKTPKTKAGRRTVSLPDFAIVAIRDHRVKTLEIRMALGAGALPPDMWVFGDYEGKMPNPYSISDRWRDAVKNRNLPKVTFHALRHTHASALINAGLDVVAVSRRLGHASPTITLGTYSHLFKTDDSVAAAAMD